MSKASLVQSKLQQSLTIDASKTSIEYDEELSNHPQFFKIDPGEPPIEPPNGDTLLHLLFFLIYTAEGRQLLADNPPSDLTPDTARTKLKAALKLKFPTLDDSRLDPVIDAHFAADSYVSAYEAKDPIKQHQQEAIYSQKLLAILGALHDDAMGHEFSMGW
jgi:hypothetical protein